MASRRSDSNRTPPAPARSPASTPSQVASTTPTRTAVSTPDHAASSAPNQAASPAPAHTPAKSPLKSPVKSPSKAATRRTPKAKADPSAHGVVSEDLRRAMIAEAAYFHAERRSFALGGEVEDWLAAEAEVDALLKSGGGTRQ